MQSPGEDKASSVQNSSHGDVLSQAFFRDKNVADMVTGPDDPRGKILRSLAALVLPVILLLFVLDLVVQKAFPLETLLPYTQFAEALYKFKVAHYLNEPTPDVLVIGSSRIRQGVNAKEFGRGLTKYWGRPARVYNLGLDNAQAEECYALVTSFLGEPPPPYVIIGISGSEAGNVHNFRFASRFLWNLPHLFSYLQRTSYKNFRIKHVEYYLESILGRHWYLFEHRDALKKLVTQWMEYKTGLMSDKGWASQKESRKNLAQIILAEDGYEAFHGRGESLAERIARDPGSIHIPPHGYVKNPTAFNDDSVEILRLTLDALRKAGSKVILVEAPPSPYLQEKNQVNHGQGFRRWMTRVARDLDVGFIPFPPKEKILSNDLYGDTNHLNPEGALKYTRILIYKLIRAGFIEKEAP